jgi:penicillin G amidase
MKRFLQYSAAAIALIGMLLTLVIGWYLYSRQPQREGTVSLRHLHGAVSVAYDERGVPHIRADNEADMYRALGFVHAQDRLFQMEIVRRLANGELAEILGPELVEVDRLFRTLGLHAHAESTVAAMDMQSPAAQALQAYLDGVNQYQDTHEPPVEFNVLRIPKRPFTPQDTMAVTGYLAYSFAAAFKTEPVMTFIRDKLGAPYLRAFDTEWNPLGVTQPGSLALAPEDWQGLTQLASASEAAQTLAAQPLFQGSNAWAISGKRTASGKPVLAGDPHIAFSVPSVWFEAHASYPGYELYGHFQALNPLALLGHNSRFGWSLTMFENDDIDLIAEKINPEHPSQVWFNGQWVEMSTRTETIRVKGQAPVLMQHRMTPHGPLVNDAFKDTLGRTPIAMWWAFLQTENPVLQAFYELNRADTLDKARQAASKIHAPGLNVVWANAAGDIGWWAAARLPQRPQGVNPMFILDASKGEAEKPGYYHFAFNPHEENPARGYIVSANHQPGGGAGLPVPGYYLLPDRVRRLDAVLAQPDVRWTAANARELQLDVCNDYPSRVLKPLMPVLQAVITDENDKAFLEPLRKWDGCYSPDSIAATLFSQFSYELARAVFADEMGEPLFNNMLQIPALEHALPLVAADANSPWWDNVNTVATESRYETVRIAWVNTLTHLRGLYGSSLLEWSWARAHSLELVHPLGMQKPLNLLFNIGPYSVPGGRETPNNLSSRIGPAPWKVSYGPSTRRVIDFAEPDKAWGINPAGQSGVLFNRHYADQTERYVNGVYVQEHLAQSDVEEHTRSTLWLQPAP